MGKKFKQVLEGKHRNHYIHQMGLSTGYVVIHEICTNKILTPDEKTTMISRFCQSTLTVQEVADLIKQETLDLE